MKRQRIVPLRQGDFFKVDNDLRYSKVRCLPSDGLVCISCQKYFQVLRTRPIIIQCSYVHSEGITQNLGFLCYSCQRKIELRYESGSLFQQGELETNERKEFK